MEAEGSITRLIGQFQAGDEAAMQKLWEAYFHRLVALARKKLRDAPRRMADEEDVALSVFDSFFRAAQRGQFPKLEDRDDLWRILVALTARKSFDQVRDERRQKRGGGKVLGESALVSLDAAGETRAGLEQALSREPTPEFAADVAEQCARMLALLPDRELRQVAVWKMEGHTTDEIATKISRTPRSVERKLQLIRSFWEQELIE